MGIMYATGREKNFYTVVIYTGGTFDVPHAGHAYFFRQIKELFPNSYVIVSLNTDEFVEEYKGKRPLYSYKEREYLVGMFYGVDQIIENKGGKDSKPAILEVEPDVIAIGSDWLEKDYLKQMDFTEEWLRKHGISLIYIPNPRITSTTEIKKRIQNA